MRDQESNEPVLDRLAERAGGGDREAEAALFGILRVRFELIAKRRVQRDDLEDVVQDALRIVHAKYHARPPHDPFLPWGLLVLRNVIGNYYQKRERLDRETEFEERLHSETTGVIGTGVENDSADGRRNIEAILAGIHRLARTAPRCGKIFQRILESMDEGGSPREVSSRAIARLQVDIPNLSRDTFYVALHRCRQRLRDALRTL